MAVHSSPAFNQPRSGTHFLASLLATGLLLVAALLVSFPFLWMIRTSLLSEVDAAKFPPVWIPPTLNLDSYEDALTIQPFARYILNSLFVASVAILSQLLTASMGAYAFARLRFPGRDRLFLLYLATMLIPGQFTIVPFFVLVSRMGWVDSYMGLIVPGMFSVFITFMLRQFFLSIPMELEDAAKIDGASYLRTYATIVLPLLIIRTRELRTVPLGLAAFQLQQGHTDIPQLMAGSTMAIIPIIIVFLMLQRYYVEGIALTGVKG